jgi:hypothetical protein
LWDGNFAEPLDGMAIVGREWPNFGVKRAIRNFRPHKGEDLPVVEGTPVKAMNGGEVAMAEEMQCEGRMVVLDHGHGWLSVYLHLSEIAVAVRQRVIKGQEIGRSGASGSCCDGAHLHAGVRWQGVYVNPADVLKLEWPMPGSEAVKRPSPPERKNVAYDFAARASQTVWRNEAREAVAFGCAEPATANCVATHDRLKLEDGKAPARVIEMRPVAGGSLSGAYAISEALRPGDKFLVKIGFVQEAGEGKAIWRVHFQSQPDDRMKALGSYEKSYDRTLGAWEIDLSPYAGQRGTLILEVINLRSGRMVWIDPRIER